MSCELNIKLDPGEELSKKAFEILKNPPKFNRYGREIKELTFSEAFSMAQLENPELTEAYMEYLFRD
jgi:hypothetical protein